MVIFKDDEEEKRRCIYTLNKYIGPNHLQKKYHADDLSHILIVIKLSFREFCLLFTIIVMARVKTCCMLFEAH